MDIKSRKSIHREDKTNSEKTVAQNTGKVHYDADKRSPIQKSEWVSEEFSAIHGSQESLYEDETENSYSTSFENITVNNNESIKSSRAKQDSSFVRTESAKQSKLKPNSQHKAEQVHWKSYLSVYLVTTLVCLVLSYFLYSHIFGTQEMRHHCSFNDLKDRYPNETDTIWQCLKFAIDDLLDGRMNKPSVTLFLHNGTTRTKELITDIAYTVSNCLDSSMEPIELKNSDFTSEDATLDYGVIIDKYNKIAKEGSVVMIENLNEIPAKTARALHAICDRESPMFRKVVILLSLTAEYNGERPVDIAENVLHNLWDHKILENELGPLITRVTDEVLLLESS